MIRPRIALGALAATGLIVLAACTGQASVGASSATSQAGSAATSTTTSNSSSTAVYDPSGDALVQMVKRVEPAVVNITSTVVQNNPFFGQQQTGKAVGTGFIVASNGVIVTNDHVIESARAISVMVPDGRSYAARVVAADSPHDLAVLQIEASGLPTLSLGNSSKVQLGEPVVAIGYALDLGGGPTVTNGIISSLARTIQVQDSQASGGSRTYQQALQTSAAINPGNSGGPLLDLNGNVIGINTAGSSSAENIGFAITSNAARSIIESALGRIASIAA